MLGIFHNLLISLLLTCRRLGLLGRGVVQRLESNWETFVGSMSCCFRRAVGSLCYRYAAAPLVGWPRPVETNLLAASFLQLRWLLLLGRATVPPGKV